MNVTVLPATKTAESDSKNKYQQLRVAAYCRVSTAQEEQLNSYQVQIDYYTDYICKNKNWQLAGIFADEGISGTQTKNRTEFNRMIRLCKKKKIDLVLCKSISRFARNTVDCLEYVRQLKELGIGVIFEKENINTLTMTSEFMITLYGSFAQAESESISKNVTWGMEKRFREGKVVYNYKRLLGYKKGADGKPEIIPEEANVVREIFRMFLDGLSIEKIAKQLDSNNVPTKLGNEKWSRTGLQSILRNEKYVGDALLQKTYTIDCISHKAVKNNGERPKYLVSNAHEPIIDRDTFNRAQQELARRASKRQKSDKAKTEQGKYSSKYALSEILICDECGSAYKRVTWRSGGKKTIVWRCINRLDHGSRFCHKSPSIHEDKLNDAIVNVLNEYYDHSDNVREMIMDNIQTVLTSSSSSELFQAEQRLLDIDKARNDFISLLTSGGIEEDSLDQEFQKLFEEEHELNEKVRVLKAQNDEAQNDELRQKEISEVLDDHSCKINEYDDIIVRKLIQCVKVINKSEIKVIFKDGHEVNEEVKRK
jgi:DNA invertase Pin-like site-specific DNA recombinase